MAFDISSLTWWASFWDTVSVIAAAFVLLGVVGESVADFEKLAQWTRLARRPAARKSVEKAGLLVLIVALAVEVVAAIGAHDTNAEIISVLNSELDQTIKHAVELTNLTNSLRLSNRALQKQIKDQDTVIAKAGSQLAQLADRGRHIEEAVAEQKARDDDALKSLKAEENRLATARKEVVANAGKASSAAEIANKVAADMSATLKAEQAMQQRMREILTPRVLTPDQITKLVGQLGQFKKTEFDLFVANDPDSTNLIGQIGDLLEKAGWIWKAAPTKADINWSIKGKPMVALITTTGLSIEIAQSKRGSPLDSAAYSLWQGLLTAGIPCRAAAVPDEKIDKMFDKSRVHIAVGSRF